MNGLQSLVLQAIELAGAVVATSMASTIQHTIASSIQQAAATTFLSVPHFTYRCKLAGDKLIKYSKVVLGKLL